MSREVHAKTGIVIASIVAAAGIAVASYVVVTRLKVAEEAAAKENRSVSDVLNDCYIRMKDIQDHLVDAGTKVQVQARSV